jgi:hypothetical protein
MKIIEVNIKDPSSQEIEEIERLKTIIERAVFDGKISGEDIQTIQKEIITKKPTSSAQIYRKITIYRIVVTEKLKSGELEEEWEINLEEFSTL